MKDNDEATKARIDLYRAKLKLYRLEIDYGGWPGKAEIEAYKQRLEAYRQAVTETENAK